MPEVYRSLRRAGRRIVSATSLTWLHLRTNPDWAFQALGAGREDSRRVIVVGSAHRVGSTWLFHLLRDLGWMRDAIHQAPDHLWRFGALWPGAIDYHWLADIQGWAILKGHADPPQTAEESSLAHFVTIHRDPRDVLVSASFQLARLPVEMGGWGEEFAALSPARRMEQLLNDPNPTLLCELEGWFRTPFALRVAYEELQSGPESVLTYLSTAIGLGVNSRQIAAVVARNSFAHVTGRSPGQEADAAARKGITGDWRTYFTSETVAQFKSAQNGRWNALAVEMGYASSRDW